LTSGGKDFICSRSDALRRWLRAAPQFVSRGDAGESVHSHIVPQIEEKTMKKFIIAACAAALLAGAALSQMQDDATQPQMPEMHEMPKPQKEHAWLMQLEGEWISDVKMPGAPDQPGVETKGSETARSIGGFWIVAENKGDMMGTPFTGLLTLGYDTNKDKYIGTWIDSVTSYMWVYEGSVDSTGKVLTLNTEGPSPMNPETTCKFKETLELKGHDHKVFTSSFQDESGEWQTMVTINYQRKN
jgi:hypothetical protein